MLRALALVAGLPFSKRVIQARDEIGGTAVFAGGLNQQPSVEGRGNAVETVGTIPALAAPFVRQTASTLTVLRCGDSGVRHIASSWFANATFVVG